MRQCVKWRLNPHYELASFICIEVNLLIISSWKISAKEGKRDDFTSASFSIAADNNSTYCSWGFHNQQRFLWQAAECWGGERSKKPLKDALQLHTFFGVINHMILNALLWSSGLVGVNNTHHINDVDISEESTSYGNLLKSITLHYDRKQYFLTLKTSCCLHNQKGTIGKGKK